MTIVPCLMSMTSLSSVPESKSSGEWIALTPTLGRDGSTELTYTFGAIRFEWCIHPVQTRPRKDPSGTCIPNKPLHSLVVPFDLFLWIVRFCLYQ